MITQSLYEQQESGVEAIHLQNPHPYPITLDFFNNWQGIDSSYYHKSTQATPRLKRLAENEEITINNASFIQVLGGDVTLSNENNESTTIYNGQDTLLEYGTHVSNTTKIKALGSSVSLIWATASLFVNDSATNPRNICSIQFHPSTTDFYTSPLRWIRQDILGSKKVEVLPFSDFGPHYKNNMYRLPVDRMLSNTSSFQLRLPAKSSLSFYMHISEECPSCLPCCEELIASTCPVIVPCKENTFPYWLIPLFCHRLYPDDFLSFPTKQQLIHDHAFPFNC